MAIEAQNGDHNIYTSAATVFSKTAGADGEWELDIRIGDGSKDLHTNAATLTLVVTVDGATIGGGSASTAKDAAVLRAALRTGPTFVANGNVIAATLQSNNSNDTDVDVTVTPRVLQADVARVSGGLTAAGNLKLACDGYSVTRGLTGTAVPAAAADAAGGLPISDAGGLDMDNMVADNNSDLAAAVEAALVDDGDATALLQAIADKFTAEFDIEEITLAAVAGAVRDAILDRVLTGNHNTNGTVGMVLQYLDALISSRHEAGAAVAKSPASLDWAADVSNKPILLTQQNVADALKLAPTAGDPAAGSANEHLAEINVNAAETLATVGVSGVVVGSSSITAIKEAVWGASAYITALIASIRVAIWSGDSRTLTGSALGLGPTASRSPAAMYFTFPTRGTWVLCFRQLNPWAGGEDLDPADVSTIHYSIFTETDYAFDDPTPLDGHDNVELDKANVLYDEVQSDGMASNWNFKHIPDVATNEAFPTCGVTYVVEYTIQPTSGQKIVTAPRIKAV